MTWDSGGRAFVWLFMAWVTGHGKDWAMEAGVERIVLGFMI